MAEIARNISLGKEHPYQGDCGTASPAAPALKL
jgi:hypothetical protein